jgi:hypothetical protein
MTTTSPLFGNLRETLLKGGVAPRHVRRYLDELRDHLDDLTAMERQSGHDGGQAAARARVRLGGDRELAAAMLEQKQFRSWAHRAPWLVFLLLPPLAAIAVGALFIGTLVLLGLHHGFLEMHAPPPPQWFQRLAQQLVTIANLTMMPSAAAIFAATAARQRLSLAWPMAATALLLVLFVHCEVSFVVRHENMDVSFAPIFMADSWRLRAANWPLVSAQYLLTIAPVAWLARRRLAQE